MLKCTVHDTSNNNSSTKEEWIDEACEKAVSTQDSIGIIINNKKYVTRLTIGNGKNWSVDAPELGDDKLEGGPRRDSHSENKLHSSSVSNCQPSKGRHELLIRGGQFKT